MSCRTVIYKGMFLADQLGKYYPDLHEEDFESALALVHQRFSTNTFPAWSLAHPYRMIAHNGEINTLRGNVNWMAARQASVSSELYGKDISRLWPISYEGQSDTACFDNALEFLVQGGYSLPHAVMMMIPEAWAGNPLMDEQRRAFYEYHAAMMEPWDGPAAIAFTDGRQIGATLDRNGLRPARYLVTKDDRIVMASEMGVLTIPEEDIITKWRLQPGKMLLVDLVQGRLIPDDEIKASWPASHPYSEWLETHPDRAGRTAERGRQGRALQPVAARSPAGVRLQPGRRHHPDDADGVHRRGSRGFHGHRHADLGAVEQAEAAVHLLQAELRAGHQPADRSDPRRAGDEPRLHHRTAAEPVRPARRRHHQAPRSASADPDRRGSRKDPLDLRGRRVALQVAHLDTTFHAGLGAAGMEQVLDELCARAEARCAKASTSSSCPTAWPAPIAFRSRRCWPAPPCIIT
jgi:glutamate synthase (NADPH/NADH) large chain